MINTKKGFTPTPTFKSDKLVTPKMKLVWGFTLIELIMVVAIISLLTSIVLSSLTTARQKGNDTAKIQALHEVQSALQLYFTDKGSYPGGDETTLALFLVNGAKQYIGSINPNIKYRGTDITNSSVACGQTCASYHLGIPLQLIENSSLRSDKDINIGFQGLSGDCGITLGTTDYCLDVTP